MKASMSWIENMKFVCDNHGLTSMMDAHAEHGGSDSAPTPKELILNAMMGCTAMDVISMLKKMRQEITSFKMEVEAEKTNAHPIHFKSAVLVFYFEGSAESEKVIKAIDASLTKYCGVNYMISKSCDISFKAYLNGSKIKESPVVFIEPKEEEN